MLHAVLLTLALGLAAAPAGAQPSPPRHPDWATPLPQVSNLHQITPVLYRSARLDSADVAQLQALGVKTVISLRSFQSRRDTRAHRLSAALIPVGAPLQA